MKKIVMYATVAAVLAGFSGVLSGAQQEQWLSYHTSPEAYPQVGDMRMRQLKLVTDKPELVDVPEFKNDTPLFAKWNSPMAKGGFLWMAFDREHKRGNYDRLVIDSNGDGNLKDEKFIDSHRRDHRESFFGPAPVYFDGEDGPITYHLNFRLSYRSNHKYLYVSAGGWYEGMIQLGDQKLHCMLIDYNGNGQFNDISPSDSQCDRIRVGKSKPAPTRYVGNYLEVDGVLYQPTIARDGAFITIQKAKDVIFGNVRTPDEINELTAGGENGLLTVKLENGLGKLPVGQYRLVHWKIDRKDDDDHTWTMQGSGFDKNGDFAVTKDRPVHIPIGEPVLAHLEVRNKGTEFYFNHKMRGQLNELIEITRNGSQARAPKLQIVSGDQTYKRSFQLEYG